MPLPPPRQVTVSKLIKIYERQAPVAPIPKALKRNSKPKSVAEQAPFSAASNFKESSSRPEPLEGNTLLCEPSEDMPNVRGVSPSGSSADPLIARDICRNASASFVLNRPLTTSSICWQPIASLSNDSYTPASTLTDHLIEEYYRNYREDEHDYNNKMASNRGAVDKRLHHPGHTTTACGSTATSMAWQFGSIDCLTEGSTPNSMKVEISEGSDEGHDLFEQMRYPPQSLSTSISSLHGPLHRDLGEQSNQPLAQETSAFVHPGDEKWAPDTPSDTILRVVNFPGSPDAHDDARRRPSPFPSDWSVRCSTKCSLESMDHDSLAQWVEIWDPETRRLHVKTRGQEVENEVASMEDEMESRLFLGALQRIARKIRRKLRYGVKKLQKDRK